jgi:CheY-like chemotaxis protein
MTEADLSNLEGFHFLIVDDQEFVRHIVREALVSTGVRNIATAINGEEAIQLIQARADGKRVDEIGKVPPGTISRATGGFDCVVTDFNMQPVTGLQLLKSIRAGETNAPRDTPVALLTAHSDDHLVACALALDVNAFVVKPVSRIDLLTRVVRALRHVTDLKPASAYAMEEIPGPVSSIALRSLKGAGIAPGVLQEAKPGRRKQRKAASPANTSNAVSVPLEEVVEGSTLLMDVRSEKGVVLLSHGTRMTAQMVQKLMDLKDLAGLADKVWIRL